MTTLLLSAGTGLILAALLAASPLTVCVAALAPACFALASRRLPPDERRRFVVMLSVGLAARAAFVAARFVADIPNHNDLVVGALSGDEAYYLSRALRARDILLGHAHTTYDYFVATDEYGRTSYLRVLTALQVILGPTPYGMRLLNGLLFTLGAAALFRLARPRFGPVPAFAGLAVVLFMPSLFVGSVSLLKESLYFLVSALLLSCALWAFRARHARMIAAAVVAAAVCLWLLDDLRRGGFVLGVAGIGLGVAIRLVAITRTRMAVAAAVVTLAVAGGLAQPPIRARLVDGVTSAAKAHAGHVFTVGHAYKLMDEEFYGRPEEPAAWDLRLTEPQALRFLVRAAATFLVTPLPWELQSMREVAFLPEHLLWYVLLLLLPSGVAAGWKRDPLLTAMLAGFALPTAAILAVTTGNVGTLLRLRGLVTPYLVWLSAVGACVLAYSLIASRGPASPHAPRAERITT